MTLPLPKLLVNLDYVQKPKVALLRARREEKRTIKYVNDTYKYFTGRDFDFYGGIVRHETMNFSGGAGVFMAVLKARRVKDSLDFSEWCERENISFDDEIILQNGVPM